MNPEFGEHHHAEGRLKQWYANIDASLDRCKAAVALVARVVPGPRVEGFGTGFFYRKDGVPFFITAKHVLDDALKSHQRGELTVLLTRGRKEFIDFSKREFFAQSELDVAIAPLSNDPPTAYAHVDFLEFKIPNAPLQAEFFAFTGFPASKNRTYTNQQIKPHQRVVTFWRPTSFSADLTSPFLEFPLDAGSMHKSDLSATTMTFPNALAGMSGGPVFAIGSSMDNPLYSVFGVGVAWCGRRALKVLRFEIVDAWLSHYGSWQR